ncbi:hypothetical protein SAMN04487972_105206 [Paracoccus halophilus]|uniref:DUF454 domain-containing protein n=1 Tax=Paracoccus halophilus TaxID=376733 RepID=A0A099F4R8_9RHOB|nr:YbaN family protein [Paracoccus halophilus]KGJ05735.1 hypothetical protein IT41_05880 [Paracoccus halophilus]SFA48165.1 hypothetical protein SAMN04487972_105206 [Paracoccus halophilus]
MRLFWLIVGWFTLGLGVIGLFLPVVPTVPFLLLSVFGFARSSPRLAAKIIRHPRVGPPIRAWRKRGVIGRGAKIWAVSAMAAGVGWALWLGLDPRIIVVQALTCTAIGAWLITRPEP